MVITPLRIRFLYIWGCLEVINFAQVVAALAAGGVLTIAVTLVCQLHGAQHKSGRALRRDEEDQELETEIAARVIEETFRLLERASDSQPPTQGGLRPGWRPVRSKADLELHMGGTSRALATLSRRP